MSDDFLIVQPSRIGGGDFTDWQAPASGATDTGKVWAWNHATGKYEPTATLTNYTLVTPTIASTGWANANHAHTGSTSGGQLDHGAALTGLGDDDHTQYLLATGARTGASSSLQPFANGISIGENKAITIYGTQATPFTIHTSYIDPFGTVDDIFYWAYNLQTGVTTGKVTASEPTLKFAIEADYDLGDGRHFIEYNMDYLSADDNTNYRAMSWICDRDTQDSTWQMTFASLSWKDQPGNTWMLAAGTAASRKITVQAGSAQSGALTEWLNSGNGVMASVGADGSIITPGLSSASGRMLLSNTNLRFYRAAAGTNSKNWDFDITDTQLQIRVFNDALSSANNAMIITRNGIGVSSVEFPTNVLALSSQYANIVLGNSSAIGVGGSSVQLRDHSPAIVLQNIDAASNNKIWTLETDGTRLFGRAFNDAVSSAATWIDVTRSGASVTEVKFASGTTRVAALRIDQTPTSETITPTHTVTVSLNGVNYKIPCAAA